MKIDKMVNECTWYCENCDESFCEHCEKVIEIKGHYYCDDCAEIEEEKNNK